MVAPCLAPLRSVPTYVLSYRASLYLSIGLPTLALADARACLRLRPDHVQAYFLLGNSLHRLDRPEEAVRTLQRGLQLLLAADISGPDPDSLKRSAMDMLEAAQRAGAEAAALADTYNCSTCSALVAAGKPRNSKEPRHGAFDRAVAALKAASGRETGSAPLGSDSDGEETCLRSLPVE